LATTHANGAVKKLDTFCTRFKLGKSADGLYDVLRIASRSELAGSSVVKALSWPRHMRDVSISGVRTR
jgi:hypothetical protein